MSFVNCGNLSQTSVHCSKFKKCQSYVASTAQHATSVILCYTTRNYTFNDLKVLDMGTLRFGKGNLYKAFT